MLILSLGGGPEDKRKIHTVSWSIVCAPKEEGGLGVRDTKSIVKACSVLNLWNIAADKQSLWVRWVHGKYLRGSESVWSYKVKPTDSWIWQRLLLNRGLVQDLLQFKIGPGVKFMLWKDPWIQGKFLADFVGQNMILALGYRRCAKVGMIIEGNVFKNFTSRRLLPFSQFLQTLPQPEGDIDCISIAGKAVLIFSDIFSIIRPKFPVVKWAS